MIDRLLRRITVRRRITGLFLIFTLLLVIAIPLIVINQSFLLDRLQQVTEVETKADRLLLVAAARVASSRVNLIRYTQDYAPSTYEAVDDVDQALQLLTKVRDLLPSNSNQQGSVTLILDALTDYKSLISDIETARQAGDDVRANQLQFQAFRFGNDIGQRIELIVQNSQAQSAEANLIISSEARANLTVFIASYVGALVIGSVLAVFVARSLTRPITELRRGAEMLQTGDLNTIIPVTGSDELSLLAQTFNELAIQLRDSIETLEYEVNDRTLRLDTIAGISEYLNTILELDTLLSEIVNQVKINFNYYHVHIYLVDEKHRQLVVVAGTGDAGEIMKETGHKISLDAPVSLVAQAARTGEIVQIDNVREAPEWLPNALLPDTYAEMAVPILLENKVVGVLDVQEDKIAGLDEVDAQVLRSLVGQVAVAIRNARLFEEAETRLADLRQAQEQYVKEAWDTVKTTGGHRYQLTDSPNPTLYQEAVEQARQAALVADQPTIISVDGEADKRQALVAPVQVRGQKIGDIQLYTANPNTWDKDNLAIIEAVIEQIGQTAENLRLFDETREQGSREQAIREITDKLRAAPNLERLVDIATEELSQRLAATHAKLELGIEESLSLSGNGDDTRVG